jgi:hypothetical protein
MDQPRFSNPISGQLVNEYFLAISETISEWLTFFTKRALADIRFQPIDGA